MGKTNRVEGHVAAPPDVVYALLSDVTTQARWNPTFDDVEWMDAVSEPSKGAHFRVTNVDARFDWSIDECVVIVHDPPRRFAFARIHRDRDASRWTYDLAEADGGTDVSITHEVLYESPFDRLRALVKDVQADTDRALTAILGGLRAAAEERAAV